MKKITTLAAAALVTLFGWQVNAQNGGDDCASAVVIAPGTFTDTTITDGTAGGFGGGVGTRDAAWFSYTPAADGFITVSSEIDTDLPDTRVYVHDGTCAALNTLEVDDDDGVGNTSLIEELPVVAGTEYFIEWDDRWSSAPLDWSLTYIAPPACPDVENITSSGNPDGSNNLDWDDAAGAAGYNYEVQPQGTAQGTAGALVMDASVTSDAVVATGVLTDGSDYTLYVQSDCGAGALGNFQSLDFTFAIPPANDTCDGAIDLDDVTSPVSGTTVGAANNYIVDCLTNANAPDVLYSITVPNGYLFDFVQTVNDYDSKVRIAYGGSCPGDTAIVCFDDPDTGAQQWTNDTGAEQEVYIVISAFSTAAGTFTFDYLLTPPAPTPGSDDCASAVAVTEGTYFQTQINDATAGTNTGDSAWFAYTASEDGTVNVNSCLGGADTRLFILDDCAGVAIADNDDACAFAPDGTGSSFASEVAELDVTSGTTYYIQWDDRWSVDPFDWSITFTPAPTCPEATNVAVAPSLNDADISWDEVTEATTGYIVSVFTTGADPMADTPVYTENVAAGTLMTTATGLMDTTTYDAYVYADCDALGISVAVPVTFSTTPPPPVCGGKFYDTGGPDADFMNSEDYQVTISPDNVGDVVTASFVFVDNAGGGFDMLTVDIGDGNFVLVPDVALGDPAVDFTSIAADGSLVFNFVSSTVVPNPGWDADITCGPPPTCPEPSNFAVANVTDTTADFTWDDVTEAADGYTLSVFDAGADPMVDTPVYTEDVATGVLTATATGLTETTPYDAYINAICGAGDLSTLDLLNFTTTAPLPANDECANAIDITCDSVVTGTTLGATQAGQQTDACGTTSGAPGVWYTFENTQPVGSQVTFSLCSNTDYDSKIQVYSGDCDALVCVDGNDDSCGLQSEISITTDATTTYYVYIFGFGSNQGNFELTTTCTPLVATCDAPENLAVSNVTTDSADFTWDVVADATNGYTLTVFNAGDDPLTATAVATETSATNSVTVTGLTEDTDYDAYVLSNCDTLDSELSTPAVSFTTEMLVGFDDNNLLNVAIFPNPTSSTVTLTTAEAVQSVSVYSVLGQEVMTLTPNASTFDIDLSNVANGTYFVKATSNGATSVNKIIKE